MINLFDNNYKTFAGSKISEYGLKNGFVDYACIADIMHREGGLILCNELESKIWEAELYCGYYECYDEETDDYYYKEFYQFYIIPSRGADFLSKYTNETVFYIEEFDLYLWALIILVLAGIMF